MEIFVGRFEYGKASLAKVEVIRETEKTYVMGKSENIFGWVYIGRHLKKQSQNVFISGKDALTWLIKQAEDYTSKCADALEEAIKERKFLVELKYN